MAMYDFWAAYIDMMEMIGASHAARLDDMMARA